MAVQLTDLAIFPPASARLARAWFPRWSDLENEGRMSGLLGQAGLGPVFIPLVWSITLLSYLGAGNKVSSIGVAFSLTAVLT